MDVLRYTIGSQAWSSLFDKEAPNASAYFKISAPANDEEVFEFPCQIDWPTLDSQYFIVTMVYLRFEMTR